ncbi:MAG: patatin-like phospholipase family protein [Deltaproteobacteria bacterium]|nr:patatin-like phospholipase family protein [Deltaproteobacteria bacterium]
MTKRALVLSGGGSRGSWQAGALDYFADSNAFPGGFGLIHATSVGAINALGLAMYPRTPLGDSLDFDGDRMKAQIEQGYADAQTFLGP